MKSLVCSPKRHLFVTCPGCVAAWREWLRGAGIMPYHNRTGWVCPTWPSPHCYDLVLA